jgi:hypothetical protein
MIYRILFFLITSRYSNSTTTGNFVYKIVLG